MNPNDISINNLTDNNKLDGILQNESRYNHEPGMKQPT